jgi:hypothetical protein
MAFSSFRPSAGPRGGGEGEPSRARVRSRSSRWAGASRPIGVPHRPRSQNRITPLSRLVAREARSVASRQGVSGIWPQGQPLSDTTYIARGCVPNLDFNEASVKLVGCVPEKGSSLF